MEHLFSLAIAYVRPICPSITTYNRTISKLKYLLHFRAVNCKLIFLRRAVHECVYTVRQLPRKNFQTSFEFVDFQITCTVSHKIFNSILSKLLEVRFGDLPFRTRFSSGRCTGIFLAFPVYIMLTTCILQRALQYFGFTLIKPVASWHRQLFSNFFFNIINWPQTSSAGLSPACRIVFSDRWVIDV